MSNSYNDMTASPYPGLRPYLQSNRLFFFGREDYKEKIIAQLITWKLTILYGVSGVGKSSILRAGVADDLPQISKGWKVIVFPPLKEEDFYVSQHWWQDPLTGLKEQLKEEIGISESNKLDLKKSSLIEILKTCSKEGVRRLFIILDQFEDYFFQMSNSPGEDSFAKEFTEAVNNYELNVNFLISIREESVAKLDCFKRDIPNLLNNRLEIKPLKIESVREVITKPIYLYNQQTIILDSLHQSRLTILTGDRDTYKSTLLKSCLQQQNSEVFFFDSWRKEQDWLSALKPVFASSNYQFIILDQFEQYLQERTNRDKEGKIIQALSDAIQNSPVNILIAMREQEISKLENLINSLPSIKYLHLFKDKQGIDRIAEDSKEQPLIKFDIDSELVKAILEEDSIKSKDNKDFFEASYLQLIMTRVWNEAVQDSRFNSVPLTLQKTTYEKLGSEKLSSAQQIIKDHLNQKIDQLSEKEREMAVRIFYFLITPSSTQLLALNAQDLTQLANENRLINERELKDKEEVAPFLEKLSRGDTRILTPMGGDRYQIFFHGLSDAVLQWVKEQRQIKYLEQDGENAKTKFKARKIKQIEALISLIETGKIIRNNPKLVGYNFAVKIISILQEVLREIQEKNQFDTPGSSVYGVNFNPSGPHLAIGSSDGTILVWNLETKQLDKLSKENSPIYYVSFSPDGKKLAVAMGNDTIGLWDIESQKQLNRLSCGNGKSAFSYLSFSEDGKLAASAIDGTVCLWDLETSKLLGKGQYQRFLSCVSISPDGKKLACASSKGMEGEVYLLDATDENLKMQPTPFPGSQGHIVYLSFISGSKQLVAASQAGTFYEWNMEGEGNKKSPSTSTLIEGLAIIYRLSFSPDNKYLATVGADGTAYLWDRQAKKAEEVRDESENIETFGDDKVTYCSFSPHGNQLATASYDGTVSLWDRDSKKLVDSIKLNQQPHRVNFSNSEQAKLNKLAIACLDGMIYLYDLKNQEKVEFENLHNPVWCASFNPDGTKLASASEDGIVRLWDLKSKELKSQYIKSPTYHINFSPDGQYLAIASVDCIAHLWNLKNGEVEKPPEKLPHKNPISWVSFSPDGKYLATASGDTVSLWEIQNKEKTIKCTFRHEDLVWCVNFIPDFTPDKQQLATGCADGFVRLWSLQGWLIAEFPINKPVVCVSPSPDGKWLAAATWGGMPRLINLDGEIDERRETLNSLLEKGKDWLKEYDIVQEQMKELTAITKGDRLQELLPEQSS
jgi:WD40 repeat protein